jgi:hypothetical protein
MDDITKKNQSQVSLEVGRREKECRRVDNLTNCDTCVIPNLHEVAENKGTI